MNSFDEIKKNYITVTQFSKKLRNEKTGKPISTDRVRKLLPDIEGVIFFADKHWIPKNTEDPRKHWGRPRVDEPVNDTRRKVKKKATE
jgi:hypothetical protein